MNSDDRMIIEISSKGSQDYNTLKNKAKLTKDDNVQVLYTDGNSVLNQEKIDPCQICFYNFIFIRDDHNYLDPVSFIQDLVELLSPSHIKRIAIAIHKGKNVMPAVAKSLDGLRNQYQFKTIYDPVPFSHVTGDRIWNEYIKSFIEGIGNKAYDELYNRLWDVLARPDSIAYKLRYDLLSPLVALDLITQAYQAGNIDAKAKNKIINEINEITRGDYYEKIIFRICAILDCDENVKNRLKQLAEGASNSKIDHNKLKMIADELEVQISEIAYK